MTYPSYHDGQAPPGLHRNRTWHRGGPLAAVNRMDAEFAVFGKAAEFTAVLRRNLR